MKKRMATLWIAGMAMVGGCASTPPAPTVEDLAGEWKGEWTWRGKEGNSTHAGDLAVSIKPMDDKTWNLSITAPNSSIPGDHLVVNATRVSDTELSIDYQGAKMTLTPVQDKATSKLKLQIRHPKMGTVSGEGSLMSGLLRAAYSEDHYHGSGTITLEKKSQ